MCKEFWKKMLESQKLISKISRSCEVLTECFWLSKLKEMNGIISSIYRKMNGNENWRKQISLGGNWVEVEHE